MATKQLRENRKMRLITVATAAMLVVLAGAGIAGASVVTISITLDNPAVNPGESTTYEVKAIVADNYWAFPSYPAYDLKGGLASFLVNMNYSSTDGGVAHHKEGSGPPPLFLPNGKAAAVIQAPFTALTQSGDILPGSGGTDGVKNTFGTQPLISPANGFDYVGNPPGYQTMVGYETEVLLFTGTIEAVAAGTVDIGLDWVPNANDPTMAVYKLDTTTGAYSGQPDTVVLNGATLTVIPEPTTIGLLGFGIVALLRRRRQA